MDTTPGKERAGQLFSPGQKFPQPFGEQVLPQEDADAKIGQARTEIIPIDKDNSRVREFGDLTGNLTAYSEYEGVTLNLNNDLPSVLRGIDITISRSSGEGAASETGIVRTAADTSQASMSLSASAKSHVGAEIAVRPDVKEPDFDNIDAIAYTFFMPVNFTMADVRSKLATIIGSPVNAWPRFRTESVRVVTFGASVSFTANASLSQSVSANPNSGDASYSFSEGEGKSQDKTSTQTITDIAPTIHAAITLATNYISTPINATAQVGWTGNDFFESKSKTVTTSTGGVAPVISPHYIPATNPSAIPTTGLYLYPRITSGDAPEDAAFKIVRAIVVNFANIA